METNDAGSTMLDQEPAIMVREPDATSSLRLKTFN
jgi:hypothetical protein